LEPNAFIAILIIGAAASFVGLIFTAWTVGTLTGIAEAISAEARVTVTHSCHACDGVDSDTVSVSVQPEVDERLTHRKRSGSRSRSRSPKPPVADKLYPPVPGEVTQ
jgi:hypothetical protein